MEPEEENKAKMKVAKDMDEKVAEKELTKLAKKKGKRKKVFWATTTIAETMGREQLLQSTLTEMLIFLLFLVVVVIYCFGLRDSAMFYLSDALRNQFAKSVFTADGGPITFEDVNSASDFWFYLEQVLINKLFWNSFYGENIKIKEVDEKNMILYENKVLGVPRIRQVRVINESCVIHGYFQRHFKSCFDAYTTKDEDKESFGLRKGTAWIYSDAKTTKSEKHWGYLGTYDGGGYYADLTKEKNSTAEIINELKENLWITRATRSVFIDLSVYNANINLFCVCKLVFEFPASGGVYPSSRFQSVKLLKLGVGWEWVYMICEYTQYALAVFFLFEEIREMVYFRFSYFTQFWNYVDLSIVALCAASFATALKMGQVGLPHKMDDIVPDELVLIKENPDKYGNLEYSTAQQLQIREMSSVMLFMTCIKLFKYLNFNRTMGQLNNTLEKCAMDIVGFSVMFFIAFVAFAQLGYLIFGSQVEDFSTFGTAMFTLLRTILGDFDYTELQKSNRILAPIYFVSYIFLVFFVLLNMFLAIITDTYSDVKTEIALTQKEMQMTDYLKFKINNLLRKCGCKQITTKLEKKKEFNITISKIRDALTKCGFTDIETEMFFARYDIDPAADISEANIDKFVEDYISGKTAAGQAAKESYVTVAQLMEQESKIEKIEDSLAELADKVAQLLRILQQVGAKRRQREET